MRRKILFKVTMSVIVLALIIWAISCAVNPVTGKREFMLLTQGDELALGQQTDQEIIQTYGLYDDPELLNYVTSMGKKMGSLSHRPQLNYQFRVLDSPVINAFAVPGGYIYVTRGILAYLNNEAELAGVLGHELGHVAARHSAQQYSKAQLAQIGLGVGMVVSETFRKYAGLAQFGVGMLFLSFSRDNERQADALGVEYSSKGGWDSNHMANFFVTLERLNPESASSGLPAWFSTHPNPPDRIAAIKKDTQKWQTNLQGSSFVVNRDQYLQTVDGVLYGEDPRQGYVEGNAFYHPQMKFQFPVPSGWQLNNTPSQVQMFTQQQDAVMLFSMAKEGSPAAAAEAFVANTKATVVQSEPIRVSGMNAHRVVSDVTTEQGVIRVASYFIQKDNAIYYFHGYTGQPQFDNYQSSFNGTMAQFKPLTDPAKINVMPSKLAIKKTAGPATLRNLFQQYGVPADKMENLAIMNEMQLNDTVPANTMLKVVVK
jgi:predicted Zn-dependent protease